MPKQNFIIRAKKKKARAFFQENRLTEARDLYRQICQSERRDADAWFMLGLLNGLLRQMEEAISCTREAIAVRPDFAEAHYNLAKALQAVGRPQEAQQSYRSALALKPQWPEALNNLGNVLRELGRPHEAGECYWQALSIKGDYTEALLNLGNVFKQQGKMMEAVEKYRRALEINPGYIPAYKFLGGAQIALGQLDEALASYRRAAELDPADTGMVAAQAVIFERQGLIDQAYAIIKPYLEDGSVNIEFANVLALLCDHVGRCDEAISLLEKGLTRESTTTNRVRQIVAHFNLGRLYDRRNEYEKAFAHFKAGNDLQPHGFDREKFSGFMDALIDTFDSGFMRAAPRATHGSRRPIFIVGMPRSGTSLVEQILSSHPQVWGGGELEDIKEIAFSISAAVSSPLSYPRSVRDLTVETCNQLAARYLDRLTRLSSDARYVTDKMPQNFLALGLITLLFPGARIIHCARDPMDTCLSCYFHDFIGYHPYVYQLDSLGFYYRQYRRLMHHWQEVLPDPILNVSYEALVEDQESSTRELLAFCDLPWDEECLRFYESNRVVHTSSYQQVRKPIYKSSLARWRHYEPYLEPLRKALESEEFRV